MTDHFLMRRRQLLKAGAAGAGFVAASGAGLLSAGPLARRLLGTAAAAQTYIEVFPTSPLILNPFKDALPVPKAARPVADTDSYFRARNLPAPAAVKGGLQDANGAVHQIGPADLGMAATPLVYHIRVQVGSHRFTTSAVLPIDSSGKPAQSFDANGRPVAAGQQRDLPPTLITGFNADWTDSTPVGFPGARINAAYGQPVVVRFENQLDVMPAGLSRNDFGSPEMGFLTHLHNGHTAPESDGNPHYRCSQKNTQVGGIGGGSYSELGYLPGDWVDNLYLNYAAGGDDREKQSFLWFHDHFHNHTGANVYKGMVGLFPIYDPGSPQIRSNFSDSGDERAGLRLPGVKTPYADGSFDVDYDIPLAFYDVRLDDGITVHQDFHADEYNTAAWNNVKPGQTHPEWWGQSFFKHFPNHGFVGDIFTVNGVAFPVLEVKRRRYRFRTLDASISRAYELSLMSSKGGYKAARDLGYKADDLQGQYRLPDGQQCMRMLQVESGGGLLPRPILRDKIEIWPAMRRGFVVDFRYYQDGSPTSKGDVIYLVNTCKMPDGRMPTSPDPAYKVPMMKIVIGDDADDNSLPLDQLQQQPLRPQPDLILPGLSRPLPVEQAFDSKGNPHSALKSLLDNRRQYKLERGGSGNISPLNPPNDNEWTINGNPFDETVNGKDQRGRPTTPRQGVPEIWEVINGGGGWIHPMHMHQEEHHILMRNGKPAQGYPGAPSDPRHADDTGKDDVVALDPSESVIIYRNFRTFKGKYVAHCHNLAHEDHSMMFGWEIV
jgi:FtsP/CotA-like multicopper oxidase with cupredoxin domain